MKKKTSEDAMSSFLMFGKVACKIDNEAVYEHLEVFEFSSADNQVSAKQRNRTGKPVY